jgi:hypothetical protein
MRKMPVTRPTPKHETCGCGHPAGDHTFRIRECSVCECEKYEGSKAAIKAKHGYFKPYRARTSP